MNLTRVANVLKTTTVFFFIFLNITVFSQNQSNSSSLKKDLDTIKSANEILVVSKDYISKKEYNKAVLFLAEHYHKFSENLYINWLYAYALSMNNNNLDAKIKFKKAISIDATNKDLQLDYARFLYKIGKINKVETILSRFLDKNSKNLEFLMMQANINFWKGDIKKSRKIIAKINEIYPNTNYTKNLEEEIATVTATYIKTNFEYQTDSQPLDYFASHIITGEYISRFLSPELKVSRYSFTPENEGALIIQLKNQFYFNKLKLTANAFGGIYINDSDTSDWIGGLSITKDLIKNTSLKVGYAKNNLLGTIASTSINLTYQSLFSEIDYSNKWILLHSWYDHQMYYDDNVIKSFGTWILSQPIKLKQFSFQIGYSFNYTDSEDTLFFFNNQGVGVYNPYFTPEEQEIHSGIFIVNYKPTKKIALEAKVNYGFVGNIRNPYPVTTTANTIEIGGFYDATFTPKEFTGNITYNFSNNFIANITYIDQETFFYSRKNINFGLNFIF